MIRTLIQIILSLRHPNETTEIERASPLWGPAHHPGPKTIIGTAKGVEFDAANSEAIHTLFESRMKTDVVPAFKLIFLTVAAIMIGCGVAQVVLAQIWHAPTINQQSAFDAFGFAWKSGIGAIFGLWSGKAY